ncbi:MAG: site-2 protease family protein [Bacteroidetes bacterium]|nr:site-2 protease family protein [Bacteroidota bacterium]HET6244747.1 site-2 protease family protein [Bacteroidia bacterium]
MKWSLNLGKIAGIKLFVHWTFILLLGFIIYRSMSIGLDLTETLWFLLFVLVVFICVVLHELGHALTARRYNIITKDIILLPIGGLARLERMPDKPGQELKITIAGPLVNVAIAILLYGIISVSGIGWINQPEDLAAIGSHNFLYMLLFVNVILAVFNMIPAFPMDGGRVLRALLSYKYPRHIATQFAATLGKILSIGFVILGLFYNPFLIIIGIFIFLGAQAEADFTLARSFLSGYKVKDLIMHHYNKLSPTAPLSKAVELLLDGQGKDFLITENEKVVGTLSRNEIIQALAEKELDISVGLIMNPNIKFLKSETSLDQMYQEVQQNNTSLMPVMEDGILLGVVDTDNILEFIMIKEAEERKKVLRN